MKLFAAEPTMDGRARLGFAFGPDCSYGLGVAVEYDPAKDAANIAKHGVSLALPADLKILTTEEDRRIAYPEPR
jgi:hypothetical protein